MRSNVERYAGLWRVLKTGLFGNVKLEAILPLSHPEQNIRVPMLAENQAENAIAWTEA